MQVLPLFGTTVLMAATAYVVVLATQQDVATIPVIGAPSASVELGPSARQIRLAPNARDDAYYTAITDRPLFQESRRPLRTEAEPEIVAEVEDAAPSAPATPTERPVPDVRLLGVLAGGARTAALLSLAGDDPEWHSLDTVIEGWTLAEIAATHVVFTEKEREHRVELYQR